MKKYLVGFWFSLPIQLFFLHFRKYQVFLIFWYLLFATVGGNFLHPFGADSLFLAPEYFNEVNALSSAFVGMGVGVFIMSWNIATFILHSMQIRFLATTAQPFLKYCINNSIIPVIFLIYYFFNAVDYNMHKEFMQTGQIVLLVIGFLGGLFIAIFIAFAYFFGADKTIYYSMGKVINSANKQYEDVDRKNILPKEKHALRVDWFLSARLKLRKPREIRHYSPAFVDAIFKRHHVAAVIAFTIAFIFLIGIGFIADEKLFQIPAAASVTVFFALLIAMAGAFSTFLKTWSIPVVVFLYMGLNYLYEQNIIDPRNKACGLNYQNKNERPIYDKEHILALASNANMQADKQNFIKRLDAWKANQKEAKPALYIINTSGGGLRSANFTFNTLQRLDSLMGGQLMKRTILINGASGGLLGAAYYRELYLQQQTKNKTINLQNSQYVNDVSKDLLNPLFSSFVSRDIIGPVQKFKVGGYEYVKDRGYAFEQKFNENTHGILNKSLQDYRAVEDNATIPTLFFNAVISRDGRKMIMCTQPVRFLMKQMPDSNKVTVQDADAVDFNSFFEKQNAGNVSILTALRMNATFPYVLPNVWLPTNPVIDVMDAGLRDNFGQETALRFINVFRDWLKENTSKVVLLQIRDRSMGDWDKPYESKSLIGLYTHPAFLLQNNWYKLQDFYQRDQLEYLSEIYGSNFKRICFQYTATTKDAAASLNFHLTGREKKEIAAALTNEDNKKAFEEVRRLK